MSRRYLKGASAAAHFTMTFGDRYADRDRPSRTLNQTVAVCGRCNSGWMSQLEGHTKSLLEELADGWAPTTLMADDQLNLARWLAKTAVVHELCTDDHRVSTPSQRRSLAAGGLPEGWLFRVGAYEGTGEWTFVYNFGAIHHYEPPFAGARLSLHTLRLECFVAQTVVHSLPIEPSLENLLGGSDFAIARPTAINATWPPSRILTDKWLEIVQDLADPGNPGTPPTAD